MSIEQVAINDTNKYYETVGKFSFMYEIWKWADNNNIKCIPRDKNKLESLEELDLSNLELADIPEDIMWLTNLKKVSFSNNGLSKFPYCILNRIFPLNCMQTSYFRDLLKNWCLHFEKSLFSGL